MESILRAIGGDREALILVTFREVVRDEDLRPWELLIAPENMKHTDSFTIHTQVGSRVNHGHVIETARK